MGYHPVMLRVATCLLLLLAPASALYAQAAAAEREALLFDDAPLREEVVHPAWFKLSFLHLHEDLREAVKAGKRGLIVYFGQKHCPYCEMLMKVNFGKPDIVAYTRKHFDVVALDAQGDAMVTTLAGKELSERALAESENLSFTPSLVFYDAAGREALRLRGYYPPYRFRAALEYVADGHYLRESFRAYLARADASMVFEEGGLNHQDFFAPAPYNLARHQVRANRPLVVFFEQGDCHACDVLHTGPMEEALLRQKFEALDAVQLDLWAETPVVTPSGERTTSRAWAERLGLFYAPTLLFFDETGREILRVDSVAHFYRLNRVLDYVTSGAYRTGASFQSWQRQGAPKSGAEKP